MAELMTPKEVSEQNELALVRGITISEDHSLDLSSVKVYAEVSCPSCGIRLATYEKYVESSDAIIGRTISVSFTGSCYNKGYPGSGRFDWSGTASSATIYEISSD